MSYHPAPESLAAKVVAFFAANPLEDLSPTDIAVKFNSGGQPHTQLRAAVEANLLAYDEKDGVYRKGIESMAKLREEVAAAAAAKKNGRKKIAVSDGSDKAASRAQITSACAALEAVRLEMEQELQEAIDYCKKRFHERTGLDLYVELTADHRDKAKDIEVFFYWIS